MQCAASGGAQLTGLLQIYRSMSVCTYSCSTTSKNLGKQSCINYYHLWWISSIERWGWMWYLMVFHCPPPLIPFSDMIGTTTDTTVVKFRQKKCWQNRFGTKICPTTFLCNTFVRKKPRHWPSASLILKATITLTLNSLEKLQLFLEETSFIHSLSHSSCRQQQVSWGIQPKVPPGGGTFPQQHSVEWTEGIWKQFNIINSHRYVAFDSK